MPSSLIPTCLEGKTAEAPTGHRFLLYFPGVAEKSGKADALQSVAPLGAAALQLTAALRDRQTSLAQAVASSMILDLATTSPLVTGTGIEHLSENGFAFLSPYGVPYLPGSSIKGVTRRAAEELALGPAAGAHGWDLLKLWRLFGFEDSDFLAEPCPGATLEQAAALAATDETLVLWLRRALGQKDLSPAEFLFHLLTDRSDWRRSLQWRGALRFWDSYIEPAGGRLAVDVLTPHHRSYYEKGAAPADCEAPVPVPFLCVPPGSKLRLVIECDLARLPAPGFAWQQLAGAAATYAGTRLGFGAKTAAGYGALAKAAAAQPPTAAAQPAAAPRTAPPRRP